MSEFVPSTPEGMRLKIASEIHELTDLIKASDRYRDAFLGCDHWPRLPEEEQGMRYSDLQVAQADLDYYSSQIGSKSARPWWKFWA